MQFTLVHVGPHSSSGGPLDSQIRQYLTRCSPVAQAGAQAFKTETALLEWLDRRPGRSPVQAVLLDGRGRQMSSEAFAAWLAKQRDEGARSFVFAIGPADGWSDEARSRARLLLSLGSFTLAHDLARLVMAEQLYRACTILSGHPYHRGH